MQNPKLRPKRMIDIETDCVKAVNTYMQVKAESNDFIKLVYKTIFVLFYLFVYIHIRP